MIFLTLLNASRQIDDGCQPSKDWQPFFHSNPSQKAVVLAENVAFVMHLTYTMSFIAQALRLCLLPISVIPDCKAQAKHFRQLDTSCQEQNSGCKY